ncbi:MAG: hypothetical protein Unbinned2716contig1004_38 [Prokaryotic dsDNA virus sp.]|nr:MAG: hypothetical protein Unbinned2716contig1004_38 [Prokaryotic dsDNA virus sp.]|tara:strand:- start:3049 stop:3246 length:198 start_codon:yes stop_codon:yes gene_type:complete
MKIKANEKINRLNVNTAPVTQKQMTKLKRGNVVEVDDDAGKKLVQWGFAEATSGSVKKSKSKENK